MTKRGYEFIVKLRQNGFARTDPVVTDTRLIQTFFLVLAEFLLISMYDNSVKTDSGSTCFCLLQTSLSVPTLETMLDTTDRLRL